MVYVAVEKAVAPAQEIAVIVHLQLAAMVSAIAARAAPTVKEIAAHVHHARQASQEPSAQTGLTMTVMASVIMTLQYAKRETAAAQWR